MQRVLLLVNGCCMLGRVRLWTENVEEVRSSESDQLSQFKSDFYEPQRHFPLLAANGCTDRPPLSTDSAA